MCREVQCGNFMPDLSSSYSASGESDLYQVRECRQHCICRWVRHGDDVVGGLRGGVLLVMGEDERVVWFLFEGLVDLGVYGLKFVYG